MSGVQQKKQSQDQDHKVDKVHDSPKKDSKLKQDGKQEEELVPQTEEEMIRQEKEDDQDMKLLKDKLKKLQERQPPKDKDELIDYLMERLEQAESAILAAEEVITHERQNRKTISKKLKVRNNELRVLVEKEKRQLKDKVHDELEITLQQALKEKIMAEQKLEEAQIVMKERDMMFEEIDLLHMDLRKEFRESQKLGTDQQKQIENLEEELHSTKEERDYLQKLSDERQQTIDTLNGDLDEAQALITKLEECRLVMNKLMGPNGLITERERNKFMQNVQQPRAIDPTKRGGDYNNTSFQQDGKGSSPNVKSSVVGLNNVHPFVYEGSTQIGGNKLKNFNAYGGNVQAAATLMDDANEDEFWYQPPKNGQPPDNFGAVGASGGYQGYVGGGNPPSAGGMRGNSRHGGMGNQQRY
eukprot:403366998